VKKYVYINKKPWDKFLTTDNEPFASADAIDFLDHLLRYDHQERILPLEAMEHAYFQPVKAKK
jgi:casein kinase II subunit alpha